MNFRLIFRILGIVAFIMAGGMLMALPWGHHRLGGNWVYEKPGVIGLLLSILVSVAVGAVFSYFGRRADRHLLRKEALAVVPLSWLLATVLAALPYLFSGTCRTPDVTVSLGDALFEATSGLTTTGATIFSDIEKPEQLPRTILFWRAVTHFMGGLGIMVFLVAILGYGTAGKRIMILEAGGGVGSGTWAHYRRFALMLVTIYATLVAILTVILCGLGVAPYDAVCHAFSALSTGGFSTFNASVGHFAAETNLNAPLIEMVLTFFMLLGGMNFVLLYFVVIGKPREMFKDVEWRTYLAIVTGVTLVIFISGLIYHDFDTFGTSGTSLSSGSKFLLPWDGFRLSLFQVASLMTTTGFVTGEFEKWNGISLILLLGVMFIGGPPARTGGRTKVWRTVVAAKAFRLELEKVYRPNVVRTKQIGPTVVDESFLYGVVAFLFFTVVFLTITTLLVLILEPPTLWGAGGEPARLVDLFSSTLSMFSNVGPGFGVLGARQNYGCLSEMTKLVYSFTMLVGRLDLYIPLLICSPGFWRR
jgi:trk system potassium uptake protein TrkH